MIKAIMELKINQLCRETADDVVLKAQRGRYSQIPQIQKEMQ